MARHEMVVILGENEALLSPQTLLPELEPRRRRRVPYVALVTALVAALLVSAGVGGLQRADSVVVRNSLGEEVTDLRLKACSEYPYLKFRMPNPVMHNNLAGKGPQGGAEGMVYDTVDLGEGAGVELGHQVLMVVNATNNDYHPFSARLNGMQGKYGSINLQSGSSIDLRLRFYDRLSGRAYALPKAAFTFFDLDTGYNGKSVESVTFGKNYKHFHLTRHTEVKVEDLGDGTRFSGSTMGTGADNPLDPMRLTPQQKNRAVTLTFEALQELTVTLSASPGIGPRFFTFVSRPSLMCAVTVQEGYKPPFDDIIAEPPLQQAVQSDYLTRETFGSLLVVPRQQVNKGDAVFTAEQPDGSMKTYVSPVDGTVIAAQTRLARGDDLSMRLDNKTVVVVERPQFEALATNLPWVVPGGPAQVSGQGAGGAANAPNPEDLKGYWCGPGCAGGPGAAPRGSLGGAAAGEQRIPQVSNNSTFMEYLKEPGDPVSPSEPIMTVKDGDKVVAVTSPKVGVVKSRKESMKAGDAIDAPGPLALMDIQPEVTGDATFVQYLKEVGDPVSKGDPLMKLKSPVGEDVVIKAKTVGVVNNRQESMKEGYPIAMAKDQDLMTIGLIPAMPTDDGNLKAGIVPKKGQELVEIKPKPGDLVKKGDVVAMVRDAATHKETEVLANHDGLITEVNNKIMPGDLIDRTEDGNLVTTGKFSPLPVNLPDQWPTNRNGAAAESGSTFVKYKVEPGDFVEAGATIATVKMAAGTEVPVNADKAGVVMWIQEALQPGMKLEDVMQDNNLATVRKFHKLPPLRVDPAEEWPSNSGEEDGSNYKFVKYHVERGDILHTGDPIATVEKPDGTKVDILADKPGVVRATQEKLEHGLVLKDVMEDDNLATVGKLPALRVGPGEAGCCTPREPDCPYGAPKERLRTGGSPTNVTSPDDEGSDKVGPWAFAKWSKDVGEPVEKGDVIAVVKRTETGQEEEILASKSGKIMRRQEILGKGDVINDVMQDSDLAVIGKFRPLKVGLTESGVTAPMDAIFVKWYHVVGEHVASGDSIAQVRLGEKTQIGRRLVSHIDIPSPGRGTVIEEMDLRPGQSIGQQSLSPTIAKIDLGWPWWLSFLAALILLCCVMGCFYSVMKKPKPPYLLVPQDPVWESEPSPEPKGPREPQELSVAVVTPPVLAAIPVEEPQPDGLCLDVEEIAAPIEAKQQGELPVAVAAPAPADKPDGLRLDFEDTNGVVKTVYAKWRPLGIKHNFVAPIVAHDFTINSYAKQELGVKDGWKLRRIGDEELNNNPNFEVVNSKLHHSMKGLRLWPLALEFAEDRAGTERITFNFVERPIGIKFKNRAPIEVETVYEGSPAADAGVQVGWDVIRIGEFEVLETTSFHDVMTAFKEGLTPLDDSGKTFKMQPD